MCTHERPEMSIKMNRIDRFLYQLRFSPNNGNVIRQLNLGMVWASYFITYFVKEALQTSTPHCTSKVTRLAQQAPAPLNGILRI